MTAKTNLFNDERGYEGRYFNELSFRDVTQIGALTGQDFPHATMPLKMPDGAVVPFGQPLIYITDRNGNGYIHATAICETKWAFSEYDGFPRDNSRYEKLNVIPAFSRYLGTTDGLFLEIANASPPSRLKQDKHMRLNELASQYTDVVFDTDGLGSSGATFAQYGHRLVAQNGKTIAAGNRMHFGNVATTTSVVQIKNAAPDIAAKTHARFERKFQALNAIVQTSLAWKNDDSAAWDNPANPDRWKEELIRNQALWMFDYMRKTGSRGIMEALSGGKDSSFNCAMVRVMVELAIHDLGVDGFCKQMSHLPYKNEILAAYARGGKEAAVETCMSHMLTGVYMGTNNSSYQTWYAAKSLIDGGNFADGSSFKGIGGKFVERNVQDLLDFYGYIFAVKNSTQIPREKKLAVMEDIAAFVNASPHEYTPDQMQEWAQKLYDKYPEVEQLVSAALPGHGIGYENIQARGREVLIMLFANIEGKLPIANPNLDEAYGAYATFGGDLHSGTVNWNGGLHKSDQEALMQYLEDHGIPGVMDRVISLTAANKNKPSAELQPKKGDEVTQFDEDALQGTFPQKAALARLRHHTKIHTDNGDRWMNAGELYEMARADKLFSTLDDNQLFNTVTYFYERWEGPAQHKIHASPIAPTHGENVDKQSSLRTPNLSGQSKDEIVQLGISLLFSWAQKDQLEWSDESYRLLNSRAWQDRVFVDEFYKKVRNRDENLLNTSYNLRGLYENLKDNGWENVFPPLAQDHPLNIISHTPMGMQ